ncbi:MAG TPA: hypothetical protein VG326_18500 [Tepidisphaeraceae bacterium]|nr:hypothetical protein [Tepidisphaeraceae bacterium]
MEKKKIGPCALVYHLVFHGRYSIAEGGSPDFIHIYQKVSSEKLLDSAQPQPSR